jgi:hypothetical protein
MRPVAPISCAEQPFCFWNFLASEWASAWQNWLSYDGSRTNYGVVGKDITVTELSNATNAWFWAALATGCKEELKAIAQSDAGPQAISLTCIGPWGTWVVVENRRTPSTK